MTYGQIIATIECYLHQKTGNEHRLNLPRNLGEIKKMKQMYEVAVKELLYIIKC